MRGCAASILADRWRRWRSHLWAALAEEGRSLWSGLRAPALGALLLLTLGLAALSFQVNRPFGLAAGQQPEEVYLEGFHEVEESAGRPFRWSQAESHLRVPGLGQAAYRLDLTLAAPRFGAPAPLLRLETAGRALLETAVEPETRVYSVLIPPAALPAGNLDLLLRSDPFTPAGDPRALGVVLQHWAVRPAGETALPAPGVLCWSALTVLLVVLLARRLGWPRRPALATGLAVALALAATLAWARPLLVPGLPWLPLGLAVSWAAVLLGQGAVRRLFAWGGAPLAPAAERALWSVLAFFLAVRLAGVLHPALGTWDLCFHWNRMTSVLGGNILFTIISGEWRSQETFYLPSLYLALAPVWAALGGRLVLLKMAGVLLDTSAALLCAYAGRRLLGRDGVVPLAALLYLTMPQSYIIFSWGIVSNILGQWLLLALLALLLSPAGRLAHGRACLGAAALLVPAVLAHPGTVQLTGVLLAGIVGASWLAPLPALPRPAARRWALAGVAAVVMAGVLYYSYFVPTMWASLQQMGAGGNAVQPTPGKIVVRGPVIDHNLGLRAVEVDTPAQAVWAGVQELAAEARAYYHTAPLLLTIAALAGLALEQRALALRLLALALLIALGFAALGLALNLYVRYMYFLLPFLAIGGAWWLEKLWQRGPAGRSAVVLAGVALVLAGLSFWAQHILYYPAGCR